MLRDIFSRFAGCFRAKPRPGIAIYFVCAEQAMLALSGAKPARWCGAVMGFAVLSLGRQPVPDVHILGEAYQLAWRTPSGDMAVMHEKRAGYETDIWRRRLGWPQQTADGGYAACRFPACRIELQSGAELALVTNARHLHAMRLMLSLCLIFVRATRVPPILLTDVF